MNKVGLVMTAYNSGKYIFKSLMSVANQTARPDLIVVDDASTDNTVDEVLRFQEEAGYPLRLVKLPHNMGAGLAKRVGIEECRNEFITFLDSDDFLPKRAIETFSNLQKKYNADLVCGGVAKAKKGKLEFKEKKEFRVFENGLDAFRAFMSWELCNLFANSKLVRRELLDRCPPYSENRFEEDTDSVYHWFWNAGKVVVDTTIPYYLYNINENSLTQTGLTPSKARDSLKALFGIILFIKFNDVDVPKEGIISDMIAVQNKLENTELLDDSAKRKLQFMQEYLKVKIL